MRFRKLALVALLFTSLVRAGERPLVDRLIDAYGGEEAIRGTATLRETGVVTTTMRAGDGKVVRTFQYPDKLRIDIAYGAIDELRIVNGGHGSRDGESVEGPQLAAMMLQCGRINLPYLLLDRRKDFTEGEEVDRGGRRFRSIKLALTETMSMSLEVDPETMYVVRSVGSMLNPGAPGRSFEFVADYSDYRRVNGVLFAFAEDNYAGGRLTGKTQLEKIEIAPRIAVDVFTPSVRKGLPDGHPDVPPGHPLPPGHPAPDAPVPPKATPI